MTKRINMNAGASVKGGIGIGDMTSAGNPWTVPNGLADDLINRRLAVLTDPSDVDQRAPVTIEHDQQSGALVSPDGWPVFDLPSGQVAGVTGLVDRASVQTLLTDGFVELLGSYITVEANMPSSVSRMRGQPFANGLNNSHCYIDPVNGDDSATGYTPSAAKRTLNTANWTGATTSINPQMFVLLARGSDFAPNHIIGNLGTGFTGGMSLGSYGDPAKPKPIIRPQVGSLVQNAGLAFNNPDGAFLMDIVVDCSALDSAAAARNGVRFVTATNADVLRNVLVSGVEIRPPRTQAGTWVAGLSMHKRTNDNSSAAVARSGAVRIENTKVYGGGSHGILLTGALGYLLDDGKTWGGVEVLDCEVSRCGLDYDSHGITAYGDNVLKDTNVAWTNTTGSIYYCNFSTEIGRSVGDVELVNFLFTSRDSCTYHLDKNISTPTTPAVGEFGFDSGANPQRLYINVGSAPAATDTLMAATQPPRGILYAFNTVSDMPYLGLTGGLEGHGLTFDDWASDCVAFGNRSFRNGGFGLNTNKGSRNRFIRNHSVAARLGGIGISGLGTLVEANVLVGGSARTGGVAGLICQDTINGAQGSLLTHIRRNLMVATSPLDAFIAQSDASGFRGSFTLAAGNRGIGPAALLHKGKVMGW